MSRSGYTYDNWQHIQWRGAVASAIRGKPGQAFLLEMWRAMQALSEHKLIAGELEANGDVCAIARRRLGRRRRHVVANDDGDAGTRIELVEAFEESRCLVGASDFGE